MSFFGLVVIVLLVYFLIVRPFLRRNGYDRRYDRGYRNNGPFNNYSSGPNGYGNGGYDNGYGYGPDRRPNWGMAAGGFAAGALLTWLLEQGRIDSNQYDYYNSLGQDQMMNELMEQNILQQHEIDDLQRKMDDQQGYGDSYQDNGYDNGYQDNGYQDNGYQDNGYDNNDNGGYDDGSNNGGGDWL